MVDLLLQSSKVKPLRSDTRETREAILCAAEQLFATRGIDDVSLSEITRAAGQKNRSALAYHFGSREALLQAVLERHAPAIIVERERMLATSAGTLREVVKALVLPLAAKLEGSDGGIAYLRITSQMFASKQLHLFRLRAGNLRRDDLLMSALEPLTPLLQPAQARLRMQLVGSFLFHALADQAALQESVPTEKRQVNNAMFANQLIDYMVAMLVAVPQALTNGEAHD